MEPQFYTETEIDDLIDNFHSMELNGDDRVRRNKLMRINNLCHSAVRRGDENALQKFSEVYAEFKKQTEGKIANFNMNNHHRAFFCSEPGSIMVVHSKYGPDYYDIGSPFKMANSVIYVMKERLEGYYFNSTIPNEGQASLFDRGILESEEEKVKRLLNSATDTNNSRDDRFFAVISLYAIMKKREGHEYEGLDFFYPKAPQEGFE